jgi:hypothetical protein
MALLAAVLFLFGSTGKAIAGVECHRAGAHGDHGHAGSGSAHHHGGGEHSGDPDREGQEGSPFCDCLDLCNLTTHLLSPSGGDAPAVTILSVAAPLSAWPRFTFVRSPHVLPFANGPPASA